MCTMGCKRQVVGKWQRRYSCYDLGLGPVSKASITILWGLIYAPGYSKGGGKVWGTDETNREGWKALRTLKAHESGIY